MIGSRRALLGSVRAEVLLTAAQIGLEAAWGMNEASGNRADSFGSNTLVDNNTVLTAAAKVGANAAQFTAAGADYFTLADATSVSTGDIDFWLSGWFWADSIAAGENLIISKSATNEIEYGIEVYASGGNHFRFFVSSNGTSATGDLDVADAVVVTGAWVHYFCWHDSVANTINYKLNNGTTQTLSYSGGVRDGTGGINIGRSPVGNVRYWDGRLDAMFFGKNPPGGITALASSLCTFLYKGGAGREYPF